MPIAPVLPDPSHPAQFPAAVSIGSNDLFFWMSGATAIPLYHMHPHIEAECVLPDDIREQTRRILTTFDEVLTFNGLGWRNVIKFSQFLTDMREHDAVQEVIAEFFSGTGWSARVDGGRDQRSQCAGRATGDRCRGRPGSFE